MMGRGDGTAARNAQASSTISSAVVCKKSPEVVKRWKLSSAVQRPLSSAQRNASAERFKTWRPETDGAIETLFDPFP